MYDKCSGGRKLCHCFSSKTIIEPLVGESILVATDNDTDLTKEIMKKSSRI